MWRRYFITFFLALLFVLTQQGVTAHEISHISDNISHSQKQDKSHQGFCEKCASASQLGNGLISSIHHAFSKALDSDSDGFSPQYATLAFDLIYFAQAPPSNS
jgi:hypothetical protein